jgi:hypothetical protein
MNLEQSKDTRIWTGFLKRYFSSSWDQPKPNNNYYYIFWILDQSSWWTNLKRPLIQSFEGKGMSKQNVISTLEALGEFFWVILHVLKLSLDIFRKKEKICLKFVSFGGPN